MNLNEYKNYINGKKVTVIGLGRSNMPLISLLASFGAKITACDKRTDIGENRSVLENMGVTLKLGEDYLKNLKADILFRTPGMRPDIPELQALRNNGTIITSEMDLFFELCPCEIFAVTGSDGKTTTTTLIYEMLKKEGYTCHLGGNIGRPLIGDIEKISPEDKVILELSSFQLFDMTHSPKVAVITNITPNHLDWHRDYDEYIEAKKNIFARPENMSRLVLSGDNKETSVISGSAPCKTLTFSFAEGADIFEKDGFIIADGEKYLETDKIKIIGKHNIYNYMAAIGATMGYVSPETVRYVAENFGGVEHRIEYIRTLDGVKYYNSSIDSSPNRTINTLSVFDKNVVLISGGKDKGIPYDEIGKPIAQKVKVLILIGKTADLIKNAVLSCGEETVPEIIYASTYPEAVNTARACAKEGDVVLLSPASTSFDMFNNFEERGNLFKKLVSEL